MKVRIRLAAAVGSAVLAAAALSACTSDSPDTPDAAATTGATVSVDATQSAAAVLAANTTVHETAAPSADPVSVTLSGDSASASGDGVTAKDSIVTITAGGTYRISGTLADGQIVVNAKDATVVLVLDGAHVTSTTGAAIAAVEAGQLVIQLADGSTNTLADTTAYAEGADVNAALFSAGDLSVAGGGSLTVTGNANDAVAAKDGLVIESGTVTVTAKDDGIRGKDYLVVRGGTIAVTAGGDGLKADNEEDADAGYVAISGGTVTVTAGGDGADAVTDLVQTAGTVSIRSGGGAQVTPADDTSAKGLKSGVITVLEGGKATVDASEDAVHSDGSVRLGGVALAAAAGDDGVHAEDALRIDAGTVRVTSSVEGIEAAHIAVAGGDTSIVSRDDGLNAAGEDPAATGGGFGEQAGPFDATISGGTLVIDAEGDGLDSNGTASITGGTVVVNGPAQRGNGALDVNGTFTVSGGVLAAAGSSGMAVAPGEDSAQGWLSATFDTAVPAGTTLQVTGADGTLLATFVTAKETENLVYSSSAVTKGDKYTISSGGTASADRTGGLAASGTLGSAQQIATVTAGEAPAGGFGRRGR
ncbi:carbohydrate-binding domain-containing protein [Actinoplanes sp. RD1]|uniref:carbohydrate-binding domain-containing protein n=1 Tax=Actinoplanes sp. RD1 TaxID=3064538 RepID=UPI002741756D|nr:carbohydrate-binding domain-containing protein [Actinoplanes sp. RD1]